MGRGPSPEPESSSPARPGPTLPGLRLPLCKTPATASAPPGGNCSTGSAGVTEPVVAEREQLPSGQGEGSPQGLPSLYHLTSQQWGWLSFIFAAFSVKQKEGAEKPLWKGCVFLKGHLGWKKII